MAEAENDRRSNFSYGMGTLSATLCFLVGHVIGANFFSMAFFLVIAALLWIYKSINFHVRENPRKT